MTTWADIEREQASKASFNSFVKRDTPSPHSEAIAAQFSLMRREELFDSAFRNFIKVNNQRGDAISELGGNGGLMKEWGYVHSEIRKEWNEYARAGDVTLAPTWNYNQVAAEAYEQLQAFAEEYPEQVQTDDLLNEQFIADAAKLRETEEELIARGTWYDSLLGGMGAILTDPPVFMTLPFGASAGAGRSAMAQIARIGATEGAIAMAVEIPIQDQVFRYKRELNAPWSFRDSAMNVLTAGLGGLAFGSTIAGGIIGTKTVFKAWKKARKAGKVRQTGETQAAETVLEATIWLEDRSGWAFDEAGPVDITPDRTPVTARAYDRARAQHQAGQPIDVREIVAPFEHLDPVNDVLVRVDDPGALVDVDPTTIEVDAELFQFKAGADGAGVNDTLRGVTRFDRLRAGVSVIWERADGKQFIVDGHQRLALAHRALEAGQDPATVRLNGFVLREADGVTALDARQMAAAKNIAEGSGSALDAAKIFRAGGPMVEALLPTLPPNSAIVRQGRGLAALGDDEFLQVVNGIISERYGALVGAATADPKLQQAMIDVLRRTKPANETQARSIVDQVRTAGTEKRVTEDLFGDVEITESLYLERAQVLDAALKESRKDKAVFGRLLSEEGRITETGQNRLDRAANFERLQEASDATTQISRLANTKGPVSEALTEAARQVKGGKKISEVTRPFLETIRRSLIESNTGRREARGTRPGRDAPLVEGKLKLKKGVPVRLSELTPDERVLAQAGVVDRQADHSMGQLYAKAEANQKLLAREAQKIVDELGEDVVLADPGIKARATSEEKLVRKGKKPGELTDIVRLGFLVRTPEVAARVIQRLADIFELLDEGITVTGMGYIDHKALVRFADGRVGEIQLWDPSMAEAKFGGGSKIYDSVRNISNENMAADPALLAQRTAAEEASKDLYANALARASDEWRRAAMMILPEDMRVRVQAAVVSVGVAGAPGKASKKLARDISDPDSRISTVEARDQDVSPRATKKPSEPPAAVSRITAGRASQLKNLSAIDAAPRPIVRAVDDTLSPTPDATRTGTVPDTEYEAVMAQVNDLIDDRGEMVQISREVNGQLEIRSAARAIEELDILEETFERIRLCSQGKKVFS